MELIQKIYSYVDIFFVSYLIGYATFLLLAITIGAIVLYEQKQRQLLYNAIEQDCYIPISIIVPAYNESVTIIDTVDSLLKLNYKLYEIIIIDDGSTDDTAERLIKQFALEKINRPIRKRIFSENENSIYIGYEDTIPITLVSKKNGGKADSLNMGINIAEYPYFICMDADSVLDADALKNIVRPMVEEKNIIACGGLVRIANDVLNEEGVISNYQIPKNLLVAMQMIEYDRTFLASRLLFDQFNGNLIISGAFGLFKKDFVIAVGGYDNQNIGEDMELVMRLHSFCRVNKIPYKIKYVPDAVCWSQVPETLSDLRKQRRRWHIGLFQSIMAHRQIVFNPEYGVLSFISFLYFVVYELLSPYIEVFGVVTIIVAQAFNLINLPYMVLFLWIYIVFGGVVSLVAFISRMYAMRVELTKRDLLKAAVLCVCEIVFLRGILAYTRLTAFKNYRKDKLKWGKATRRQLRRSM